MKMFLENTDLKNETVLENTDLIFFLMKKFLENTDLIVFKK